MTDRGLIHQLRNDHAAVIFTLESLAIRLRKNGVNPDWRTRFDNLMNVFLPHLDQEEKNLFPDRPKKSCSPQKRSKPSPSTSKAVSKNPFAKRMERMQRSTIREILKITKQPDMISFAGGLPAPELFPLRPSASP